MNECKSYIRIQIVGLLTLCIIVGGGGSGFGCGVVGGVDIGGCDDVCSGLCSDIVGKECPSHLTHIASPIRLNR